jgi:hypothetical protein
MAQGILHAQSIGSILETDHKVIDVAHQMGFAPQPAPAEGDNRSYRTSLLLMETPSGAPDCECSRDSTRSSFAKSDAVHLAGRSADIFTRPSEVCRRCRNFGLAQGVG